MIASKRGWKLGLLTGFFVISALAGLFLDTPSAKAAGEQGSWVNASNISLSGGRIRGTVNAHSDSPAQSGQAFPTYYARITDSTNCTFQAIITISSSAGNSASAFYRELQGTGGPYCTQSIINQYSTTLALSNTENMLKREGNTNNHTVQVQARPVSDITDQAGADSANVPKTDTITLKQGNKTLATKNADLSLAGYVAYNTSFDNLGPGNYTVCSKVAEACKDFTVVQETLTMQVIIDGKNSKYSATKDPEVCTTGVGLAGALAWVLCPVAQLIADSSDWIEKNLIVPYLSVSPLTTDKDNAVYSLWKAARDFGNIAFVIVFFVVIFSQATSIGLSNYGIKRMLPRMAVAVIASNLSYFIVAFIIDVFNVFGAGVSSLVMAIINQGAPGGGGSGGASTGQFFALGGAALAAAILTMGSALGWLIGLIGLAFLIVIVAVIVLIIRQMVILMLVVISPLAFVSWLLPNTEKYYTKWQGMLIQLLMMYPLIVLLFAMGKIFSKLLLGNQIAVTAPSDITLGAFNYMLGFGAPAQQQITDSVRIGMAYIANALPLVLIPATFMASGSVMSRLYGGMQRGGLRGARGARTGAQRAKEAYEKSALGQHRQQLAEQRRAQELMGNRQGLFGQNRLVRPSQYRARMQRRLYGSGAVNTATGGFGAYMSEQLREGARENQETVAKQLRNVTPFATQAVLESGGDRSKLRDSLHRMRQQGTINDADVEAVESLDRRGMLLSGNGLAGAATALAQTGWITTQHIQQAQDAIKRQYAGNETAANLALNDMAGAINSGSGDQGVAPHMRWGVVGNELIKGGLDFESGRTDYTYEMRDNNGDVVKDAAGNTVMGGVKLADNASLAERTQAFKEWREAGNATLGFTKLSPEKISRKAFSDNYLGPEIPGSAEFNAETDANKKASWQAAYAAASPEQRATWQAEANQRNMDRKTFATYFKKSDQTVRDKWILAATKMRGDDADALKKQILRVSGTGADWNSMVADARKRSRGVDPSAGGGGTP